MDVQVITISAALSIAAIVAIIIAVGSFYVVYNNTVVDRDFDPFVIFGQ